MATKYRFPHKGSRRAIGNKLQAAKLAATMTLTIPNVSSLHTLSYRETCTHAHTTITRSHACTRTRSLDHSLTHLFTHSLTRLLTHSLACLSAHSLVYSLTRSHTHSRAHSHKPKEWVVVNHPRLRRGRTDGISCR